MKRFARHAVVLLTLAACNEPTRPATPRSPQADVALSVATACPTPANVVVTDEAGLNAALAAAQPGEVIGLGAFFGVSSHVRVTTPNVTLTCAAPGAGLFALNTSVDFLIVVDVGGSGVAVDGLVLDGSGTTPPPTPFDITGSTYFAGDFFGPGLAVPNVRFSNNTVTCGPGSCAFFVGTSGAVVLNNTFTHSTESATGVHLQMGIDNIENVRVQGNTIIATAPSTFFNFGAIRVFGGRGVVIADNVVTGPWFNSVSVTFLTQSRITGNRFTGAAANGIRLGNPNGAPLAAVQDNLISNNSATGAGNAGVFANQACNNVFVGNNLQGNVGNVGAIFAATTGANTLVGNGTVVIDNGAFDCDGDGVNDPNIVTGARAVMHGVTLGRVVSDAVRTTTALTLQ